MEDRNISLLDMIFDIVLQWRAIIITMIVGAVLLGGFSYINSSKKYSEQQAEAINKYITHAQMVNVENIWIAENNINNRQEYQEEAVLFRLNPNKIVKGNIILYISASTMEEAYNITALYSNMLCNGELIKQIADSLGISTISLQDVIRLTNIQNDSYANNSFICLEVLHYDESTCHSIIDEIIKYVDKKCLELKKIIGLHQVNVLDTNVVTISDTNILEYQISYITETNKRDLDIIKQKKSLSDIENEYMIFLQSQEGLDFEFNESSSDGNVGDEIKVERSINIKYVILGALLGAFGYIFVAALLFCLNSKIRTNDNLNEIYGIPQLGYVAQTTTPRKFLNFIDVFIISFRDRNKRKFSDQEAIRLAAVAIKMIALKHMINTIYFIGCDLNGKSLEVCEQIKVLLSKEGIKIEIINNALYDAQSMDALKVANAAVLIEKVNATLYSEITQEIELLRRQDINILGGVIIE